MQMFKKITEDNKASLNKPLDSDMIYYSELNNWYTRNAFRSFSLKFVIDECIFYKKDGKEYAVKANTYLTACKYADVEAYNLFPIKSICIDICPRTVAETFTVLTSKNEDLDNYLSGYFKSPEFFESINSVYSTSIGSKLQQLLCLIRSGQPVHVGREWFLDLSERIVYQEYGNYLALNEINSVKPSTKKELLERLHLAKEYIDANFLQISEIKEVAGHCNMSEYHFFRRFKEVYKKTPYQYITEIKMQLAKKMLLEKSHTISDIAILCSYPDVFTFSKAFKKFYGVAPSTLR
jgi:AraC family transcriptional regulator